MDSAEVLHRRRVARAAKDEADRSLWLLHQRAAELLADPVRGEEVRTRAKAQVELWAARQLCNERYVTAWRQILAGPPGGVSEAMLGAGDEGVALRQNTPFGFLLRDSAA